MERYEVRTYLSKEELPREKQLAWRLAEMACDLVPLEAAVSEMISNRVIDNAAVAVASLNRASVKTARAMAFQHPKIGGASLLGLPAENRFSPEWAAWANGVAVRELDFHDTFLAADYSHPADNIPPLIAVAESLKVSGAALLKGIAAAYEAQVALVKGICLHRHAIDHIAHLGPSVACGLGAMLQLPVEVVYQAVQQALHVTISTRQSRKGEISSWKAFAPAHAGKLAIEAVDRCMRGECAPSPIYEGEDGVIAYVLAGRELGSEARYTVELPAPGEPKRAILQTYTKAHSAEYQAQALIDLAFELRQTLIEKYGSANSSAWPLEKIVISTSHHTHKVIGTGSGDPQKFNPDASRETLDHSLMYIFAVALEDGEWHHEKSYAKARAGRPETIALWKKISTKEEARWTQLYHSSDPNKKAFGGQVSLYFKNNEVLQKERSVANAHPNASVNASVKAEEGDKPSFGRADYVKKFHSLTENFLEPAQREAFIEKAFRLAELKGVEIPLLNLTLKPGLLQLSSKKGIF